MLYRNGRLVTVAWLLKRWQTLHCCARKVGAVSFIALLLFPAYSIADAYLTCTLRWLSPSLHSVQYFPIPGDNQIDRPRNIARQRQVFDAAGAVISSDHIPLQLICVWTSKQTGPYSFHLYPSWQDRAPPHSPCSLL